MAEMSPSRVICCCWLKLSHFFYSTGVEFDLNPTLYNTGNKIVCHEAE